MKFAIIGFGCAGYHALRAIREMGSEAAVDVYMDRDLPPYNPMLTTYYVSGKLSYEEMFPFGTLEEIGAKYHANFLTGQSVAVVDAETKEVITEDGVRTQYDRILISTGATAFVPPSFHHLDGAYYCMRTTEDAVRMRQDLDAREYRSAVVVGASMAGIKVAELLNKRGIQVTLADMSDRIFPLASYKDVASIVEKKVQSKGISLKLGNAITGAEKKEDTFMVRLGNGEILQTDLLVLNIGTRAACQIVDRNQIRIGRGIVVNERMETNMPGVFAAGDCCEGMNQQSGENQIIGLWANAGVQGYIAGANMAGKDVRTEGNILHNITHFLDMDFIGVGDNRITGERLIDSNPERDFYIEAILRDGKPVGFNILNNYAISGILKAYFMKLLRGEKHSLTPVQWGMLKRHGVSEGFIKQLEERK